MKKFALLLMFVSFFVGCKDEVITPERDMDSTLKVTSITDIQLITELRCYSAVVPNSNNEAIPFYPLVIQTDSSYQLRVNKKNGWPDCTPIGLPTVNFKKRTLIGIAGFYGGGCEPIITYEAVRNDSTKRIYLTQKYITKGADATFGWFSTWISIPKIPIDYSVVLEKSHLATRDCP
jgi:hypothetical protein